MAQMVLPQTPSPGVQKDPGSSKASSGRDSADRKSDFESVSQAEKKRLDREKANRSDSAKSSDDAQSAKDKVADTKPEASDKTSGKSDAGTQEAETRGSVGSGSEMEPVALPLTFAELQTWMSPQKGQSGEQALPAMGDQALPAMARKAGGSGQVIPGNGLFNDKLSPATGQQTKTTLEAGSETRLTDSIKASAVLTEARPSDAAQLSGSGRFQTAMDLMSQQVANGANGAAKLANENMAPLRGYATSIDVPVGHAEWGDKLVGKLSWLTARNMSVAEIHLTPPDMGPMEVKVRVQNEQANITVHSANPVVRDQLELHSHRLRDMLNEQGLSLSGFDVSDSPRQQTGDEGAGEGTGSGTEADAGSLVGADQDDDGMASGSLDLSWKGEVDIFA